MPHSKRQRLIQPEEPKDSKLYELEFNDCITAEIFYKAISPIAAGTTVSVHRRNNYAEFFTAISIATLINPVEGQGEILHMRKEDAELMVTIYRQLDSKWDTSKSTHGHHDWFENRS